MGMALRDSQTKNYSSANERGTLCKRVLWIVGSWNNKRKHISLDFTLNGLYV